MFKFQNGKKTKQTVNSERKNNLEPFTKELKVLLLYSIKTLVSHLNQIVDYMERDSARGAIQPGLKILARFGQTGLGFSARAEKISCNRKEISARAEKQEIIWLPDPPETIFGAETNISARAEVRHVIATKFQPG